MQPSSAWSENIFAEGGDWGRFAPGSSRNDEQTVYTFFD
jgi:hypothetical protein